MSFQLSDYPSITPYLADRYVQGKARNLAKICDDLNIQLYSVEFTNDKLSGLIEKNDGTWAIYVNASDSPKRKRFTIAHELGHYFSFVSNRLSKQRLERDGRVEDKAIIGARPSSSDHLSDADLKVEAEANFIAANLLMPEDLVGASLLEGKNIEEMADEFGVSASAMGFRLQNLGLLPMEGIHG